MAHTQKPDGFQRNGRVHFKMVGGRSSRLLAAEVCTSVVVMVVILDTPCSEVQCKTTGNPLHSHVSPSFPLPCVTVRHQVSIELYQESAKKVDPVRKQAFTLLVLRELVKPQKFVSLEGDQF